MDRGKPLVVELDDETLAAMKHIAALTGQSTNQVGTIMLRQAVADYVERTRDMPSIAV